MIRNLIVAGGLLFAGALECRAAPPSVEDLEAQGAVIGTVEIRIADVFELDNPGENRRLYRLANRLHRNTRDRTVRQLLLVKPGDTLKKSRIEESERVLRRMRFLYDATIRPVRYENGVVDLVVETRDVWTLSGGVAYSRKGGANDLRFGIEDTNVLGWGKTLKLEHRSTVDRDTLEFAYRDPSLLGSRARMNLVYTSNSDGNTRSILLVRPFYSLDARRAFGGKALSDERVDSLYDAGEITQSFAHDQRFFEAFGGWSRGLVGGRARRWSAGYTYQRDRFGPDTEPDPGPIPEDRTLSFPWIRLNSVPDQFLEARNLNGIHRTEDVGLGHAFSVRVGMSLDSLGAYRDQAILEGTYRFGYVPAKGQLLLAAAHARGRFGRDDHANVVGGGSVQYFLRNWGEHLFFVSLKGDAADNLDPELQLLLGGDTGLRGYPYRYLSGNRRILMTVEQRIFTNWHVLKLFRVGWVVFVDAGSAWFAGTTVSGSMGSRLRGDAGLGLRLASSRSSTASLLRIDLAFPFESDPNIPGMQIVVTTDKNF